MARTTGGMKASPALSVANAQSASIREESSFASGGEWRTCPLLMSSTVMGSSGRLDLPASPGSSMVPSVMTSCNSSFRFDSTRQEIPEVFRTLFEKGIQGQPGVRRGRRNLHADSELLIPGTTSTWPVARRTSIAKGDDY